MSNWCMGCHHTISDGDWCPACKWNRSKDWFEEEEHLPIPFALPPCPIPEALEDDTIPY